MVLETMTLAKVLATVGIAVKFGAEHGRKACTAIDRGTDKFLADFKAGQKETKTSPLQEKEKPYHP